MSTCPRYQKTLWLDVYNELSAEARLKWEVHLEGCEGCRQEKMRMSQLINNMQRHFHPPVTVALSPENLFRGAAPELKALSFTKRWRAYVFGGSLRRIPAMASVGIMLLMICIFSYRATNTMFENTAGSSSAISEQIVTVDTEMLNHLDLLKDMDTVQKLIQVVDTTDYLPLDPLDRSQSQGEMSHDRLKTYV